MLVNFNSHGNPNLSISPKNIETEVIENNHDQLVIVIPSPTIDELNENSFVFRRNSIIPHLEAMIRDEYAEALNDLIKNSDKLYSNAKLLIQAGQLSHLLGDLDQAVDYIGRSVSLDKDPYYQHEYGDLLIDIGENEKAKQVFSSMELQGDLYSNLRLAQLAVFDNNIERATKMVASALEIDFTSYKARMFDGALHLSKFNWELAVRSFKVASESYSYSSTLNLSLGVAYWRLKQEKKSITALKKAVHINPLNEGAVTHLADIADIIGMPEVSLPSLKKFLTLNRGNTSLQSRYARANYRHSKVIHSPQLLNEARSALEVQIDFEDSAQAHNNLGVILSNQKKYLKATTSYSNALAKNSKYDSNTFFIWANYLQSLADSAKFRDVLSSSVELIENFMNSPVENYAFGRIVNTRLFAMYKLELYSSAQKEAIEFNRYNIFDQNNKLRILSVIVFNSVCTVPNKQVFEMYRGEIQSIIYSIKNANTPFYKILLNNYIFGILKFGNLQDSEQFISLIYEWKNKDPYVAATLGMYHLKQGDEVKSLELYKNAMSIAKDIALKKQIKQRMQIEFGRKKVEEGDTLEASKYFNKALKQSLGLEYANREAEDLLASLRTGFHLL